MKKHARNVGDKAKVIDNVNSHFFDIGTVVTIVECHENGNNPYYYATSRTENVHAASMGDNDRLTWCVTDEELEDLS